MLARNLIVNINETMDVQWPVLYETCSKSYKDKDKKAAAWKAAAAEVEVGLSGRWSYRTY